MGIRGRLDKARQATKAERDMEVLAERFMGAMRDLRAQAAGNPREGARTCHKIVENSFAGESRIVKDAVEDLSE